MIIYISASDAFKALGLKEILTKAGHQVNSSWIESGIVRREKLSDAEAKAKAEQNKADIRNADALILMTDYDHVPGGKFYEAGYAEAQGKTVVTLGSPENMYMRGHYAATSVGDILEYLGC